VRSYESPFYKEGEKAGLGIRSELFNLKLYQQTELLVSVRLQQIEAL
jgi:hypothetical protein